MEDSERSYTNNPQSLHELKANSQRKIATIYWQELCCVPRNIFTRCDACWQAGGEHF